MTEELAPDRPMRLMAKCDGKWNPVLIAPADKRDLVFNWADDGKMFDPRLEWRFEEMPPGGLRGVFGWFLRKKTGGLVG